MKGIYKIENLITHQVYIGKSLSINKRIHDHKYCLNNNKHINSYLQNSWNKYGENNFIFVILEECSEENINEREKYWINFYGGADSKQNYNVLIGGEGGCGNDDWKHKIAEKVKQHYKNGDYNNRLHFIIINNGINEKHIQPEELEKYLILGWKKGRLPIPLESRKKAGEKLKGELNPSKRKEVREKISKIKKGKPNEKLKGIPFSEEHKRKISESKKGHSVSIETRIKISNTLKGRDKKI